jgi:hypothetical protein
MYAGDEPPFLPIKYARLIQRQAKSARAEAGRGREPALPCAAGARGRAVSQTRTNPVGQDTVGLDLGPSTIAIVPREGISRARGASRPS